MKSGSVTRVVTAFACLAIAAAIAVPLAFGQARSASGLQGGPPANANLKAGKALFIAACGGCHTLAAAGTKGKRGGNLGTEPSGYTAIVTQIKYGGEGMPAFSPSFPKAQIINIAAYVSKSTPYSGAGGG